MANKFNNGLKEEGTTFKINSHCTNQEKEKTKKIRRDKTDLWGKKRGEKQQIEEGEEREREREEQRRKQRQIWEIKRERTERAVADLSTFQKFIKKNRRKKKKRGPDDALVSLLASFSSSSQQKGWVLGLGGDGPLIVSFSSSSQQKGRVLGGLGGDGQVHFKTDK